ncbi:hypothetical protein HCX58_13995 [Listeria welshimeri]|nr:hypothetical protein [Listeria welshimeri]MBC1350741.1 hypothetical protein [Listeria welshimeri]
MAFGKKKPDFAKTFEDIKAVIEFEYEAIPALVVSTDPEILEGLTQKKKDKYLKLFKEEECKQIVEKGNNVVYMPLREGLSFEKGDPFFDVTDFVVLLDEDSFNSIQQLKKKRQDELIYGVRLIDERGLIQQIPESVVGCEQDISKNLDECINILPDVKKSWANYAENFLEKELEETIYESEENVKKEDIDVIELEDEVEEVEFNEHEFETEFETEIEKVEFNEDESIENAYAQDVEEIEEFENDIDDEDIDFIRGKDFNDTITFNQKLIEFKLDEYLEKELNLLKIDFPETAFQALDSPLIDTNVLELAIARVEQDRLKKNEELEMKVQNSRLAIKKDILKSTRDILIGSYEKSALENSEVSPLVEAKKEVEQNYETVKDELENTIIEQEKVLKSNYESLETTHINNAIKKLKEEFREQNYDSIVYSPLNQFKEDVRGNLEDKYNENINKLEIASEKLFKKEIESALERTLKESNISELKKNIEEEYLTSEKIIRDKADKQTENILDTVNKETIAARDLKTWLAIQKEEEVKKAVSSKVSLYEEEVNKLKNELIEEKEKNLNRTHESSEKELTLTDLKQRNKSLQEDNHSIRELQNALVSNVANINKQEDITEYVPRKKKKDSKKIIVGFVLVIMTLAIALAVTVTILFFNYQNQSASTANIIEIPSTKQTKSTEETGEYDSGKVVKILVDGKQEEATVISTSDELTIVQTKNGKKYAIQQ